METSPFLLLTPYPSAETEHKQRYKTMPPKRQLHKNHQKNTSMSSRLFLATLVAVVLLCFTAISSQQDSYQPLSEQDMKQLFIQFSRRYAKMYGVANEHERRYQIFKANVERARLENSITKRDNLGVTRFSDLTPEEFKRMFLMQKTSPKQVRAMLGKRKEALVSQHEVRAAPPVSICNYFNNC